MGSFGAWVGYCTTKLATRAEAEGEKRGWRRIPLSDIMCFVVAQVRRSSLIRTGRQAGKTRLNW